MVKILIVDDDLSTCDMLKEFFSTRGYRSFIATSADEALSVAKEQCPNIVLLDIIMPGKLGIAILKDLKKINQNIKIIMMTAIKDDVAIETAKKLGASDYITKPFSLERLEKEILPKMLKELF